MIAKYRMVWICSPPPPPTPSYNMNLTLSLNCLKAGSSLLKLPVASMLQARVCLLTTRHHLQAHPHTRTCTHTPTHDCYDQILSKVKSEHLKILLWRVAQSPLPKSLPAPQKNTRSTVNWLMFAMYSRPTLITIFSSDQEILL